MMTREESMIYVSLILPAYSSSTKGLLDVEEQQYELADDELSGDEFEPEPKTPSENLPISHGQEDTPVIQDPGNH